MQPINDFKYLGLLAFIILIIGLAFIIYKWPQGNHRTFSQHAASHKDGVLYYIALFSVVLPMLVLFFIGWFVPLLHLSVWFIVILLLSSLAQYLCTLIPETGGWKSKYHRILAGASGTLLVPLLVILFFANTISVLDRIAVVAGLMIIAGASVVVARNKKEQFEPSYIHQSIYYAGFFLPILVISYL